MEGCPESVETTGSGRLYAAGERAAALPGSAGVAWRGVAPARNFDGDMLDSIRHRSRSPRNGETMMMMMIMICFDR